MPANRRLRRGEPNDFRQLRPLPPRGASVRHTDVFSRVATGALPAGHAMPSVRSLAERLVINANTVSKAYAELVRDGVLESQQSLGFFVVEKRQIYSKAERLRRLRQAVDTFVHEAVFLDFTADEIRNAVDKRLTALEWGAKTAGASV